MQWSVLHDGIQLPVAISGDGVTACVLAHGAGTDMNGRTLLKLEAILLALDLTVVRFNFPYKARGKSLPDKMPVLMSAYQNVIRSVIERHPIRKLFIGGHSMGGRTATMLAAQPGFDLAQGLVLFGYPLHPAGKPEKLRDEHLARIAVPVLCLNGTKDGLCTQLLMERATAMLPNWTMKWIEGADHGYTARGRPQDEVWSEMRDATAEWLRGQSQV